MHNTFLWKRSILIEVEQVQQRSFELTGVQLTDVKAMLGCTGQTRFLLGCISQLQDGTYYLEDMTGSLQLDLANCQTSSGLYTGAPSWFSHNLPKPGLHADEVSMLYLVTSHKVFVLPDPAGTLCS